MDRIYTSVGICLYVLVVVVILRVCIVEPCKVSSNSMENMIKADEWLWINKVSYGAVLPKRWADIPLINVFTWIYSLRKADEWNDWGYHRLPKIANPKRSDIVVFRDPKNQYFLLVKRLIAQPGDQIEIRNGHLMLNNTILSLGIDF